MKTQEKSTKTRPNNRDDLRIYRERQKAMGRKNWSAYVTDDEKRAILALLAEIRAQSVDVNESSTST